VSATSTMDQNREIWVSKLRAQEMKALGDKIRYRVEVREANVLHLWFEELLQRCTCSRAPRLFR